MKEATLVSSHCNSDIVTREQLRALPPVPGTSTFQPIQHIALVEGLEKALANRGLKAAGEQYALRRDGLMLFGVLKIAHRETSEFITALGIRQALNRTMSIQMCAGASVFVCDNLCFRGDMIVLKQRHDWSFSITAELTGAVGRWQQHADILVDEINTLKNRTLSNIEAKAMICDVFTQGIMPSRFLSEVVKEYLEPRHEEFAPRTAWSLNNAFTEVQKQMPITTRVVASQDLGRFFKLAA
jgi:hypothetical protein